MRNLRGDPKSPTREGGRRREVRVSTCRNKGEVAVPQGGGRLPRRTFKEDRHWGEKNQKPTGHSVERCESWSSYAKGGGGGSYSLSWSTDIVLKRIKERGAFENSKKRVKSEKTYVQHSYYKKRANSRSGELDQ